MKIINKKVFTYAFSLSEVLITLAVIGIVAMLVMPEIKSVYEKKEIEARLVKFYSVMNQAILLSEIDNGPKESWDEMGHGFVTDETGNVDTTQSLTMSWYNKYLKDYIVVSDVEVNSATGKLMLYFPNGSFALVSSASILFVPKIKDFADWDEESITNNDNLKKISGRKLFTFLFAPNSSSAYHYKKGVEPYKTCWDGKRETLFTNSTIGCNENATNHQAYCTALIQLNNWKIPDDYPFKVR